MEQLERIRHMENILDQGEEVLDDLVRVLDRYKALRPALEELETYYSSPLWQQDYADDEAGRLPPDLRRGVLTEDLVYDLLARHDWLRADMRKLGK